MEAGHLVALAAALDQAAHRRHTRRPLALRPPLQAVRHCNHPVTNAASLVVVTAELHVEAVATAQHLATHRGCLAALGAHLAPSTTRHSLRADGYQGDTNNGQVEHGELVKSANVTQL